MRTLLICAALMGGLIFSVPASAESKLAAPLEQCIRSNATKVEAAIPSLKEAADFLVANICAEPVAAENARLTKVRQDKSAQYWKDRCDKEKASAKPESEKTAFNACMMLDYTGSSDVMLQYDDGNDDGETYVYPYGNSVPAAATGLASRILLDLRLAHDNAAKAHQ